MHVRLLVDGDLLGGNYNTITYCTFYNNSIGVTEGGCGTEIHQCNFLPFSRSLAVLRNRATMNATYCYWGSTTGPKVYGSSGTGSGDTISTNVLFTPSQRTRRPEQPDPACHGPNAGTAPPARHRRYVRGQEQRRLPEDQYLAPLVPSAGAGA
jgi:hypothetical protein